MALGARPADLLGIVMSKGFVLTLAGIGVGVMIALGSTHLMGDMLYKTSPRDPESFGSAFAIDYGGPRSPQVSRALRWA
jgi:ABC-type antimicrobial peptide transport system permease subunit